MPRRKGIPDAITKHQWNEHSPLHWSTYIDGDRLDYWPRSEKGRGSYKFLGEKRLGHPVEVLTYVKPASGPGLLAQAFCDMDDEQQRDFFRSVVHISKDWTYQQFGTVLEWVIVQAQKEQP